jgi:hypothetical protein
MVRKKLPKPKVISATAECFPAEHNFQQLGLQTLGTANQLFCTKCGKVKDVPNP